METTEFVLRLDPPPRFRRLKGWRFLRLGSKVVCALFLVFAVSHLPFVSEGLRLVGQRVHEASERLVENPALKDLVLMINPALQKREEAIQEIVELLGKYPTDLALVTKEELAEVIYEEALRYNYDPKFIVALIGIESSFQNWSVSERGAKGLMQIMPYVAQSVVKDLDIEWNGDSTLFNPFLNVKIGTHYLSRLWSDFNDLGLALEAYNHGPTKVKALVEEKKKVPRRFYQKILDAYQNL